MNKKAAALYYKLGDEAMVDEGIADILKMIGKLTPEQFQQLKDYLHNVINIE